MCFNASTLRCNDILECSRTRPSLCSKKVSKNMNTGCTTQVCTGIFAELTQNMRKVKMTQLGMGVAMLLHSCYFWVSNLAAYKCSPNQRIHAQTTITAGWSSDLKILYFTFKLIVKGLNKSAFLKNYPKPEISSHLWFLSILLPDKKSTRLPYGCQVWRAELEGRLVLTSLLLT